MRICARLAASAVLFALCLFPRPACGDPAVQLRNMSFKTMHDAFSIAAVDANNDAKVDLIATDSGTGHGYVYLGNGDATFRPPIDLGHLGKGPRGLGTGDFNRDGRSDVVAGITYEGTLKLLLGLGDGRFSPPRTFPAAGHPFMLTVADVNRDDILDVAVSSESAGGVNVLTADGRGGFNVRRYPAGKWSSDVAAADFNEDGRIDLAVTNWGDNNVSLLFGKADSTFSEPNNVTYEGEYWDHHALYRVLAADLDRDGHVDMLWNDIIRAALYIRYGDGLGGFPRDRSVRAGRGVRHAEVADLDGNGWLDLVCTNTAMEHLSVMLSDGRGGYSATQYVKSASNPRTVALADFNGDGRIDIAAANMLANEITLYVNEGMTTLAPDNDLVMAIKPGVGGDLSSLSVPNGIALDLEGRLLIADEGNDRVARVSPGGSVIETVAGIGRAGFSGDGGPATHAAMDRPVAIAVAADGNIYVSDFGNHRVRKIDPQGLITTIAGDGRKDFGGDGGPAVRAQLSYPTGLAFDASGNLFVGDSGNYRIRKIDVNGVISTVAGTGVAGTGGDGGPALQAQLRTVTGLATTADAGLLVADVQNARLRKIDAHGVISSTADSAAPLMSPVDVAVAPDGAVLVADVGAMLIRKLLPDGRAVDIVSAERSREAAARAGEGRPWGPQSLAVAPDGTVYFSDRNNDCVRKLDAAGTVSVVAGRSDEIEAIATHTSTVTPESLQLQQIENSGVPVRMEWDHHFFSGSDDNATRALASDRNGTIYAAGDIGTGADFHVLQLSPAGAPGWTFTIADKNIDVADAITIAPNGTIVAAGVTFQPEPQARNVLVVGLTPAGQERWRFTEAEDRDQLAYGVSADGVGNLVVVGESKGKLTAWALSPEGTLRWRYIGDNGRANAVVHGVDGTAYIAGLETASWRVLALRPDGSLAWRAGIDGRGEAHGIALDRVGDLLVTGSRTPRRVTLRAEKRDNAGNVKWEYEAISAVGPVVGKAATIAADGTSLIAGDIGTDWLMLGLDDNGKRRWHFSHDGGGQIKNRDQVFAIAPGPADGFVVAGRVHPLPPQPPSLGQVEWRVAAYSIQQQP